MKKHAFILLTTTIIFSTTCMEQERPRKQACNTLNIQTQSPNSIVKYPAETYQPEECIQIHEPGWTFSSNTIGTYYSPYIKTILFDPSHDLIPIYKPVSTVSYSDRIASTIRSITHQEKTPLLHTNNSTQNNNSYLKERLYGAACDFVDYFKSANYWNIIIHNKKVITIIELMNEAKKKGITEDFMGEFAYEKYCNNGLNINTSFVFACLKKYMLTIRDSEEKIPFNAKDFYDDNDLTQTLNVTCKKSITKEQIHDLAPSYPAYNDLIYSIKKIIGVNVTDFVPGIYSSTKVLSHDYPKYSHITNLNECYSTLISNLLSEKYSWNDIYNSLNLVEHIQNSKNIKQEKDLGNNILTLEQQQSLAEKMLGHPKKEYPIYNKNVVAVFCILVEKYHKARGKKITPNPIQLGIYMLQKDYGIALPDSFNTNLLDKNNYALEAFRQLVCDAQKLRSTKEPDLQDLVDRYYIFNEEV